LGTWGIVPRGLGGFGRPTTCSKGTERARLFEFRGRSKRVSIGLLGRRITGRTAKKKNQNRSPPAGRSIFSFARRVKNYFLTPDLPERATKNPLPPPSTRQTTGLAGPAPRGPQGIKKKVTARTERGTGHRIRRDIPPSGAAGTL